MKPENSLLRLRMIGFTLSNARQFYSPLGATFFLGGGGGGECEWVKGHFHYLQRWKPALCYFLKQSDQVLKKC